MILMLKNWHQWNAQDGVAHGVVVVPRLGVLNVPHALETGFTSKLDISCPSITIILFIIIQSK